MSTVEAALTSRRALLGAALGAAAATVASALGRPIAVRAGVDGDVVLGTTNTASTTTLVQNPTTGNAALKGRGSTGDGVVGESAGETKSGVYGVTTDSLGYGVFGRNVEMGSTGYLGGNDGVYGDAGDREMAGVRGEASAGTGVSGRGGLVGVDGHSPTHVGVEGSSYSAKDPATLGWALASGPGVYGFTGSNALTSAPAKTGVYGRAEQADAGASGVWGSCSAGRGVVGETSSGIGVYATATTGTALQVVGKAKFSRAGKVRIKKGRSSYRKSLAGITGSSQVFAVLRTYRTGTYVAAVVSGSGYFTIRLNKALTRDTYCSYFVLN